MTLTASKLPWTVTGLSTTNIQIHNFHVNILYENTPGNPTACPLNNVPVTWTGTLTSPTQTHWDGTAHQITLNNVAGLAIHSETFATLFGGASQRVTVTGTLRDTSQTLALS
jgi:hypothetical protein